MKPPSYTMQRQAIEHAIALLDKEQAPTLIDAMKAAATSIGVLERYKDVANTLVALQRDAPDLFVTLSEICAAFPGSKITRIRDERDIRD